MGPHLAAWWFLIKWPCEGYSDEECLSHRSHVRSSSPAVGAGVPSPPYAVSNRKRIQAVSGNGRNGRRLHHRRGTSERYARIAVGHSSGCLATADIMERLMSTRSG